MDEVGLQLEMFHQLLIALFAAQLYRMYIRYAERHRWKSELITANETGIGGMREAIFAYRSRKVGA